MDCEWCGKSLVYFNHDRCWDDIELNLFEETGFDPWGSTEEAWNAEEPA